MSNEPLLSRLKKSHFLRPLIRSLNLEELFFFVVLTGVLSGIADYSLFYLQGSSFLNFIFGDSSAPSDIINYSSVFLLPVGLIIIVVKRKFWWLLGLLPGFTILAIELMVRSGLADTGLFSLVLSISTKIAFLFFAIRGHLRSLSFALILVVIGVLLHWQQLVLFLALSILARFIYLFITQNISIFSTIKRKRLAFLLFKTILLWSPLLLFAIPQRLVSQKIDELTQTLVYDNTFVTRHNIHDTKNWDELINEEATTDSLEKRGVSNQKAGVVRAALYNTLVYVKSKTDRHVKNKYDTLGYQNHSEVKEDFYRTYMIMRKYTFYPALDSAEYAIADTMAQEVEKLVISTFLTGRSELELDVEMSINEQLIQKETDMKQSMDSMETSMNEKTREGKAETDETLEEFIKKSNATSKEAQRMTAENRDALINETLASGQNLENKINERLDSLENSTHAQIATIPGHAKTAYARGVPLKLTDVSASFHNADCGALSIKCKAVNMVKGFLRKVYVSQREKMRIKTDTAAAQLQRKLDARVKAAVIDMKADAAELVNSSEEKINQAARTSKEKGDEAVKLAVVNANKEAVAKAIELKAKLDSLQQAIENVNAEAKRNVETGFENMKTATRHSMMSINHALKFSDLFSNMLVLLLILKSYFYVFSRVAFSAREDLFVSLTSEKKDFENGEIVRHGTEYTIPIDHKEAYYISRNYQPTGRAPKFSIPFWTTSFVARIKANAYAMNEVEVRENNTETVDFRSLAGAEFVEWNLKEGEEVVFSYDQFVAMTENITLESLISLRLTSMLFGRTFFMVAKGPGKLVLQTKGKPIANDDEYLVRSVPIERLVAWQKSTQFSVDSELNILDIYLSSLYLKRTNEDLLIVDADEAVGQGKAGLMRFVRRFLLPI